MTEIDKMFENANAYEMICMYDSCMEYGDVCGYAESKIKEPCKVCEKAKQKIKYYPDFTAEKQIELIKFLGNLKDYTVETDKFKGVYYVGCREAGSNNKHWGSHNLFEEALAELVNNLWQSLTNQEKEEIRRILNE